MTQYLIALVDNAMEEYHYETATLALDQLRSKKFKPHPPHIRQLVYLSLFSISILSDKSKEYQGTSVPSTPSKMPRQTRTNLLPSSDSITAARRLLIAFGISHFPDDIFRALPAYRDLPPPFWQNESSMDSDIARAALAIKDCKTCWNFLTDSFMERKMSMLMSPRKKRGRGAREDDYDGIAIVNDGPKAPVGPNAWPVLEWLIDLFEKDELCNQAKESGGLYSPHLLAQIPPARNGSARWEVHLPLDIAFYCFEQVDERKRRIGRRLLTMLINLTATTQIDIGILVDALITRMKTLSVDQVADLFPGIGNSRVVTNFKFLTCRKYLQDQTGMSGTAVCSSSKTLVRPRAARPRALRKGTAPVPASGPASVPIIASLADTSMRVQPVRLPLAQDVIHLIEQPASSDASPAEFARRMKFELLTAFNLLHSLQEEQDPEWQRLVSTGAVSAAAARAFGESSPLTRAVKCLLPEPSAGS
ncbi:hypothetical protein FISHEDRAFT_77630 [Fistulina hepatica ATCC 64428]|uniref:Uncharacterized protein n=1 Tax=Fistulina hepatica ATCC 64428 TaxID=1128425 RepID=A0A0D7A240_9AGAR|nr:hypothetical protein FISHEDRAFT_77630 [Fistulina hepatica ATCC 64428]